MIFNAPPEGRSTAHHPPAASITSAPEGAPPPRQAAPPASRGSRRKHAAPLGHGRRPLAPTIEGVGSSPPAGPQRQRPVPYPRLPRRRSPGRPSPVPDHLQSAIPITNASNPASAGRPMGVRRRSSRTAMILSTIACNGAAAWEDDGSGLHPKPSHLQPHPHPD